MEETGSQVHVEKMWTRKWSIKRCFLFPRAAFSLVRFACHGSPFQTQTSVVFFHHFGKFDCSHRYSVWNCQWSFFKRQPGVKVSLGASIQTSWFHWSKPGSQTCFPILGAMDAIDFHSPTLQWEPNAPDTWKLLPDGGLWVKPMAQRDFWSHPVALETFKGGSNVWCFTFGPKKMTNQII